jgi:hypothetical protein
MANQATVQAKLNRRLSKNYGEKKAVLGNRLGVVDVGGGYCNVTLKNGDVIQILNRRVPMKPFRKIIIGYDQSRKESSSILEVLRFDDVYLNNKEPEVPGHSGLHGWLGTDPISVHSQQIVPLLPRSKQTMVVSLFGGNIAVGEAFQTIPNMEFDFTSYIPTEGARWVNVEIDDAFETHFEVGDTQINRGSLTPASIPVPASPRKLLFSVKTYVGQVKVVESGASTDIFDPRFAGSFGSSGAVWGNITGTLADQTDLQAALDDAELNTNKATTMSGNETSNTLYLTAKAVYDWAVALFARADGWTPVSETWTRTGNHTFTVSGDLTAKYKKKKKIRYRDGGGDEYGVVNSSSHSSGTTTVNLVPNSDYAMASATITDTYISSNDSPDGFPEEFNFSLTLNNVNLTGATILAKWRKDIGYLRVHVILSNASPVSGGITMTTPFNTASIIGFPRVPVGIALYLDASPLGTTLGNVVMSAANTLLLQVVNAGGTYATVSGLTSTVPFTWTTSDEISFFAKLPS